MDKYGVIVIAVVNTDVPPVVGCATSSRMVEWCLVHISCYKYLKESMNVVKERGQITVDPLCHAMKPKFILK